MGQLPGRDGQDELELTRGSFWRRHVAKSEEKRILGLLWASLSGLSVLGLSFGLGTFKNANFLLFSSIKPSFIHFVFLSTKMHT